MEQFIFNRPHSSERLHYITKVLLLSVVVWTLFGTGHAINIEIYKFLYGSTHFFIKEEFHLFFIRFLIVILGTVGLFKEWQKISLLLISALFFIYQHFHYEVWPVAWNFNTHLNFFLIAVTVFQFSPKKEKHASATIAFFYLFVGFLYFQAGMSKVLVSGVSWITEGTTLSQFTLLQGTTFGKWLVQHQLVPQIMSGSALLIELIILPWIILNRGYQYLFILLTSLHIGIYAVMGISFWHLIILFPFLFTPLPLILENKLKESKQE